MLQNMFKKINKGEFSKTFNNINNNMFNNFSKQNNPKIDMFSKNLFTPNRSYEGADDLTAAQKFGGQNLQGLQKIGSGRDRDVYALDKDKVLKVAKNPGGLTQNTGERDLVYLGMGEQLEHGKDYVVMKRQQPLSKEGKQKLAKVRKIASEHSTISPSYRTDVASDLSRDDSVLDQVGIGKDILDFQPNPQEAFANRQWGEDEEGNLVLLDGGALQDNKSLSRYRVKDYKPEDWQYQDWQEVQRQRQEFRDKGTYDKEKKFNRKYYVDPAYPYRETFNELTEEQRQEERSEFLRKQYEQQPLQDDESKNDKILFPQTLKEKNIHFKDEVISPRHKRILLKQLRKNPEMLSKKETERPLIIQTASKEYIKGYAQVEVPSGNDFESPYVMSIAYPTIGKKYDPDFDKYLEENPELDRETETQKYLKSQHNLTRTLGHEFQHVSQIERKQPNIFRDTYYQFQDEYEEDANKYGKELSEKPKPTPRPDVLQTLEEPIEDEESKNFNKYDEAIKRTKLWEVENIKECMKGEGGYVCFDYHDIEQPNEEYLDENKPTTKKENKILNILDKGFHMSFGEEEKNKKPKLYLYDADDKEAELLKKELGVENVVRGRMSLDNEPLQDEESKNLIQSLWHAGDKPPSETLNEQGRVFGFSSKEYADGWREKKGKQNIYQFTTDEYILDDKTYIRDTPTGKKYNDNEYIVKNVLNESIFVDDESKGQSLLPEGQSLLEQGDKRKRIIK